MQKVKLFSNNNELIFVNIVSKFLNVFDRINVFFLNKNLVILRKQHQEYKNTNYFNYSFLLSTVFESFPLQQHVLAFHSQRDVQQFPLEKGLFHFG